jgi:hypothetical protein
VSPLVLTPPKSSPNPPERFCARAGRLARAERQNEPPSCTTDVGLDLAAMAIGHGSSLMVTEK